MSWYISEWWDLLGLKRVQSECKGIILLCPLMWANISNNPVCTTRQPIRKAVQKWSICAFLVAVHVPTPPGTHSLKAPICSSMMQKTASRTDYIEQRYRWNSTIWTRRVQERLVSLVPIHHSQCIQHRVLICFLWQKLCWKAISILYSMHIFTFSTGAPKWVKNGLYALKLMGFVLFCQFISRRKHICVCIAYR